jgi:hypothetical protein
MKPFTRFQENLLLALGVLGLVVPNGVFLFHALLDPAPLHAALANPVAVVFIAEALGLMALFAWLIHHLGFRSPGWLAFVVLSLVGSMAFSIPAFLFLLSRRARATNPAGP